MKYFLAKITQARISVEARIAAVDEEQAMRFFKAHTFELFGVSSPKLFKEISPVTYQELDHYVTLGEVVQGNLAEESASEQARTLATRLGAQLKKLNASVSHSKLLNAVAACLGNTDWAVLLHKDSRAHIAGRGSSPDVAHRNGREIPVAAIVDAVWLAHGDTKMAATLLRTDEASMMEALAANSGDEWGGAVSIAFTERPVDWLPEHSLACEYGTTNRIAQHEVGIQVRETSLSGVREISGLVDGKATIIIGEYEGRHSWKVGAPTTYAGDLHRARATLRAIKLAIAEAERLCHEEGGNKLEITYG